MERIDPGHPGQRRAVTAFISGKTMRTLRHPRRRLLAAGALIALAGCQTGRVIGPEAPRGAYPWQAEIFQKGLTQKSLLPGETSVDFSSHRCGASLIAPDWVLTAAHCVEVNLQPGQQFGDVFQIAVGIHALSERDGPDGARVVYDIKGAPKIHPGWLGRAVDFKDDVALIQLSRPVPDAARFQIAPATALDPSVDLNVTGFGRHTALGTHIVKVAGFTGAGDMSQVLRVAVLKAAPSAACTPAYKGKSFPAGSHLCAAAAETYGGQAQSDCVGDSGGPLVQYLDGQGWYQVGIVSYGNTLAKGICGDKHHPADAFTDLTKPEIARFICATLPVDAPVGGYCDAYRARSVSSPR